jgi:hypothetical protein
MNKQFTILAQITILCLTLGMSTSTLAGSGHSAGSCGHKHDKDTGMDICKTGVVGNKCKKDRKDGKCVQELKHCRCKT